MWCYRWKTRAPSQTTYFLSSNHYYNKFEWIVSFPHSYSSKSGKKGKVAPLQERKMVDSSRVWAKGGDGGNGCWSIHRSRTDWRGKPDGGNGGKGGNVILECSSAVWDFSNLQHHLNAKRGGHGVSKKMAGSCGSDQVVQVPVGTVIHLLSGEIPSFVNTSKIDLQPWELPDDIGEVEQSKCDKHQTDIVDVGEEKLNTGQLYAENSNQQQPAKSTKIYENEVITEPEEDTSHSSESDGENTSLEYANDSEGLTETELEEEVVQYSVAELTEPGQRLLIASGGEGGLGNAYFGKSPKHKHFKYKDKKPSVENMDDGTETSLTAGSPGSETVLILELKSIADVGLVGMPNAGKSTLLGSISRAKPQVGHYAFTTLRPNIGKLNYNDFFSVTVADIPGIIKGAHENRGLGHAFLRHIERTKVLAYVVDLAAALDGRNGVPPWQQLRDLVMELEYYQEGLSERPSLVVANKTDENGAEVVYEELKRRVVGVPVFPVCAILEEGIPELKDGLRTLIDDNGEHHSLKLDNITIN